MTVQTARRPLVGPSASMAATVEMTAMEGPSTNLPDPSEAQTTRDSLPQDAQLYLRHVEDGESIRAIARDLGTHASTVLRRIRRFEARRDDPLIDRAISSKSAPARIAPHQATRILRRLCEPGAELVLGEGMSKAVIRRGDLRTAILEAPIAEAMALKGWLTPLSTGRVSRYTISFPGRDALRRMLRKGSGDPVLLPGDFADATPVGAPSDHDGQSKNAGGMGEAQAAFDHAERHRVWGERMVDDPDGPGRVRRRINMAESPLMLLAQRKDAEGRPFLTPEMISAGERIREDFELAQMGPRVTQNWDRFLTSGIDESRNAGGYGGGSSKARDRVALALRELGPGMGDLVLRVCCFLEGIEATEKHLGWSARSGKIVLRLALERLDAHYRKTYGPGSPMIG